jgi:CheY-like chemotaxis protein
VSAPLNVLVIDDDGDMLMLLTALIEHLDARVGTADSPDAVSAALLAPHDLILLDLVMPGDCYPRIVRTLIDGAGSTPIALMSGSDPSTLAGARDALVANGLSVQYLLQKPVRLDALAAVLGTLRG